MTKPRNGDKNETAGTPDNNNNKNKMKRHKGQVMGDSGSGNKLTVSQEFQKAAMEQSKLALECQEEHKYNDRLVAMHSTKVTGVKVRIEDAKFLFLHSAADDPARAGYL